CRDVDEFGIFRRHRPYRYACCSIGEAVTDLGPGAGDRTCVDVAGDLKPPECRRLNRVKLSTLGIEEKVIATAIFHGLKFIHLNIGWLHLGRSAQPAPTERGTNDSAHPIGNEDTAGTRTFLHRHGEFAEGAIVPCGDAVSDLEAGD